MDATAVAAVVGELAAVLRADGADLRLVEADAGTDRIVVCLELDGASCPECIMAPPHLHEVIADSLRRRVPSEFELVVDDPRIGSPPEA